MTLVDIKESLLTKELSKILDKIEPDAYLGNTPEEKLAVDIQYIVRVIKLTIKIIENCSQLDFVPVFIKNFEPRPYFLPNNINHPNYIEYHIQNHYIKVYSTFDLLVLLLADIHDLGIPYNRCDFNSVIANRKIKGTEIANIFKDFDAKSKRYREIRNLIAHRGTFENERLKKLYHVYLSYELGFLVEIPEVEVIETTTNMLREIDDSRAIVFSYVRKLFDSYYPIFIKKIKELSPELLDY